MVRQQKLTETFAQSKSSSSKPKLPVKRKLLNAAADENEDVSEAATTTPAVQEGFVDHFQLAKKALHTSRPTKLPGREDLIEEVHGWLSNRLEKKEPGAMYISGAPGVGKSAVVQHSIHRCENPEDGDQTLKPFNKLFINCMSIMSVSTIYDEIAKLLKLTSKSKGDTIKEKLSIRLVGSTKAAKMTLLVLDEMDQLLQGKGNEILYSLFEWARIPGSKLILIGIANALDLTSRHLPLLVTSLNAMQNSPTTRNRLGSAGTKRNSKKTTDIIETDSSVKVINFPPYERCEIEKILEERLIEIGSQIFDPAAIKFVAAKVAASTGDMRKALNTCKMALEAVEKQQRMVLKTTADDGFNFSSPKKCCIRSDKVGVSTVAKVFGPQKDEGPLPLQQIIILTTFLKIYNDAPNSRQPKLNGVASPIPMSTMYDEYRKICTTKGCSWIERCEIVSVCGMLQDRSLVTVIENMSGGGAASKKFGSMNSKNKTGFLFEPKAVEKIVMQLPGGSALTN